MSAKPSIISSTGYFVDSDATILSFLYENKESNGNTSGMVKFQGSKYDVAGDICLPGLDIDDPNIFCAPTTAHNLKNFNYVFVSKRGIFNYGCIESFGCSAGNNCTDLTCTTWGPIVSFEKTIPIRQKNTEIPLAPKGLIITPGSGSLTLAWNSVNDPTGGDVFAYRVRVLDGINVIIDGYTEAGLRNIPIGSLTAGKVYSIQIYSRSHNGYQSSDAATGSGTPLQSTIGSINFVSNPPGAEIFLDNSDQHQITPHTITGVPAGTHSYRLILLNHTDITGNVTVQANKITQVSADFTTGQVNVVALVVGLGVSALLIGGLIYYVIKKPETTRTTNIIGR